MRARGRRSAYAVLVNRVLDLDLDFFWTMWR